MPMRARLSVISTLLLAGLVVGGLPATAEAQFGKRLKDAVKRTAEDGGSRADPGSTASAPTADESPATSESAFPPAAKSKKAGEGAFMNFDFVPGDRVLFYDDYAGDNVGDSRAASSSRKGMPKSPSGKARVGSG
jgi:hypothetical protein